MKKYTYADYDLETIIRMYEEDNIIYTANGDRQTLSFGGFEEVEK